MSSKSQTHGKFSPIINEVFVYFLFEFNHLDHRKPTMPEKRYKKFQQVLLRRQQDMTVLTDQVHKARNVSAILRTADAVGMSQFHMVQPSHGRLVYHHTAGGASGYIDIQVHETLTDGVKQLKKQGMKLYAAHWSARSINYRQVDYTQPFALILGAEKQGLSAEAASLADEHLTIPMVGACESLNVSVASGIILQEALHQRQQANLYQPKNDLNEQDIRQLFRWLHPKMAAFCDARQLPYPALDADGDMIPPQNPIYRLT